MVDAFAFGACVALLLVVVVVKRALWFLDIHSPDLGRAREGISAVGTHRWLPSICYFSV